MRYYEAVAVLFLIILSFAIGVDARTSNTSPYPLLVLVITSFFVVVAFGWLSTFIEKSALEEASRSILLLGRGFSTRTVRIQVIIMELGMIGVIAVLGMVITSTRISPVKAGILLAGSILAIVIGALYTKIRNSMIISTRKTSVEVEFPFLLALMKTLSATHLGLYDLLNIIAESQALQAWAKEVRFAKRLATAMNISLFQAMSLIAEHHPSKLVRDTFKRIVVVGNLAGTVREVVSRTFSFIFDKLNMRLASLVDRLDIINGFLIFGFMFTPIILATVAPLSGMSVIGVIIATLAMEVPMSILTYALLSALYPSGFAAKPRILVIVIGIISLFIISILVGIHIAPIIQYSLEPHMNTEYITNPPRPGIRMEVLAIGGIIALLPPTILAEAMYRKILTYSKLIQITTDAAEIAASLGENFVTVFVRESHRYDKKIRRLVRSIVESYHTPLFRKAVVAKAPTIFHASFLEALLYTLQVGAPASVLKSLTESYENLTRLWDKTKSVTRTLEGMIISLSAVLGFFMQYLYKMFNSFAQSIQQAIEASGPYVATSLQLLSINPSIFQVLYAIVGFSVIVVSLFAGKTRGGSLIFGFRTALISYTVYQILSIFVIHFVEGPVSGG